MSDYCKGFCTLCGTSCESYLEREKELLAKVALLEAEVKKMKYFLNGTRI